MHGDPDCMKAPDGYVIVEHEHIDMETHCYNADSGSIESRQSMPEGELSGGEFTVQNIPAGAKILWQGQMYDVNDDTLSVLVDQPGTFELTVWHPKFMTKVYTIENQHTD